MMTAANFPVIDLQQTGRNIERRCRDAGMSVRELQEMQLPSVVCLHVINE